MPPRAAFLFFCAWHFSWVSRGCRFTQHRPQVDIFSAPPRFVRADVRSHQSNKKIDSFDRDAKSVVTD